MLSRTVIPISAHPQIGKIDENAYHRLYQQSLADPDRFWGEHGGRVDWIKPFTKVRNASFQGDVRIAWYEDGTLNASYNCIDRHLSRRAEQTAILWEATTLATTAASPIGNCTKRYAGLPTCLKRAASK